MIIGILGSPKTIETQWLEKEAKKRGHKIISFSITDIHFESNKGKFKIISKYNLEKIDIFLVRGIFRKYCHNESYFDKATESLLLLRYIHTILKKPIIDSRLAEKNIILSKIGTSLEFSQTNIPYPWTKQFGNKKALMKSADKLKYPIIAKHPAGRKGKNIYKLNSKGNLKKFIKQIKHSERFLFQQYIPNDGDIRILVVGYIAIGAMKRLKAPSSFKANISQGAKGEPYLLTENLKKIAERAARTTKTEIAGVDVIEHNDKFYVIEVNRAPQFKGFKKYTGIDPVPAIIDYIEKKVVKFK